MDIVEEAQKIVDMAPYDHPVYGKAHASARTLIQREVKARQFQSRWRLAGGGVATIIGLIALASTPVHASISLIWIPAMAAGYLVCEGIGDLIYMKRRP